MYEICRYLAQAFKWLTNSFELCSWAESVQEQLKIGVSFDQRQAWIGSFYMARLVDHERYFCTLIQSFIKIEPYFEENLNQ